MIHPGANKGAVPWSGAVPGVGVGGEDVWKEVYSGEAQTSAVSGLNVGVCYKFRVCARNAMGTGVWGDEGRHSATLFLKPFFLFFFSEIVSVSHFHGAHLVVR